MTHSENMTFKSDYQLRWIAENKSTYSENQVNAAREELKRRDFVKNKFEYVNNFFNELRDSIYRLFK